MLCALSGFAEPGGRSCLAPVRVPWLWPRVVRRASSGPVALGAPVGFRDAVVAFQPPWLYWARSEAGALGSLRVVPVRGPAVGLSLAGPSGVGLGLHALR